MSIGSLLNNATGSHNCTGIHLGEPKLNGPYYPAMSLMDGTEICVSGNLSDNDSIPLLDVRVETPCSEGFKTLRISAPYLEVSYNDGYSDSEVEELKSTIAFSMTLLYDVSDRGWTDAGVI